MSWQTNLVRNLKKAELNSLENNQLAYLLSWAPAFAGMLYGSRPTIINNKIIKEPESTKFLRSMGYGLLGRLGGYLSLKALAAQIDPHLQHTKVLFQTPENLKPPLNSNSSSTH